MDVRTAMGRLRIESHSPDKGVNAKYSYDDGLTVSIRSGSVTGYTATSLGEQIRHALNGLLSGFRQAKSKVQQSVSDEYPPPHGDIPWGTRIATERKRRAEEMLERISVTEGSDDSTVKIGLHAKHGFEVHIDAKTLRRRDQDQVLNHVNTALSKVIGSYKQRIDALHQAIYVELEAASIKEELRERQYQHRRSPQNRI